MPNPTHHRGSVSLARDVLAVAGTCVVAFGMFSALFGVWAAVVSDSFVAVSPFWASNGAFAVVAVLSGLLVGVAVALVLPHRSRFVLGWSAGLLCALSLAAAVLAGGLGWAVREFTTALGPLLAFGFSLAALLARRTRHA
jgi:hypothetical protein